MLTLQNVDKKTIKQWGINNCPKKIIYTVHDQDFLYYFEDEHAITVFYGFLDQEYEDNPAQHVAKVLLKGGSADLINCYGSFIVMHYNFSKNEFILANDALGDFALNYFEKDNVINVSDLPEPLLNSNNIEINENRVLYFFADCKPQDNVGFFTKIKQLKPAQSLTITSNDLKIDTYYYPPEVVNYKNLSVEDLSEQYNTLMLQVIKYQTRGHDKIGSMLSGGLDSTYVSAMSLKAGKEVSTFSFVFPKIPEADESIWIDSFRNHDFDMQTFAGESYWPLKSPWHASISSPYNNPYRMLKDVLFQQAQNKNLKILYNGVYSDYYYTGYIYWLVDLFKKKPFTAIKSFFSVTKKSGFITALRQISPRKWTNKITKKTPWLNKTSRERLNNILEDRIQTSHPHPNQYALVYGLSSAQGVGFDQEYGYRKNLFLRCPFRDRRIVELLMSIPAWILGNNQTSKLFIRETTKDILPDSIVRRRKTSSLAPLFYKGLFEKEFNKVKTLLLDPNCQWQKYIKKDIIHNILKNPTIIPDESDCMILWQCISYELWLKRLRRL